MHITYTPDDDEKREWDFKLRKLLTTEAEAIEKRAGLQYGELMGRLIQGSPTVRRALVWVLRKRTDPSLQFMDVDFEMGAFQLDFDDEEKAEIRSTLQRAPMPEDERAMAFAQLGIDPEESPAEAPKEEPGED